MEISKFAEMIKDKHFTDLKKLQYKYPEDFNDFIAALKELYYRKLPLIDFGSENIVYLENYAGINLKAAKALMTYHDSAYNSKVIENEIISTAEIEKIDFNRDSVRSILKGHAPKDEEEKRIFGLKLGFDFISDKGNRITEENIYRLYMMTVGNFLDEENSLLPGSFYRHDTVYIVGSQIEHTGINYKKLPSVMKSLVEFINTEDDMDDLAKAAAIHFYVAYVHPYFDGNGRMARMIHLWYLVQQGYKTALFIPFSSLISQNVKQYFEAYTLIEENQKISGIIDVTPFIKFFVDNVYNKISKSIQHNDVSEQYKNAFEDNKITEKESKLWEYVISFYGEDEFSTKQLEKDYGNAAYATIRSFVLKFEELGLLTSRRFSNRVKYRVKK